MASLVWQFFVGPLIGFLFGGFPTAYIICKLVKGIDPREFGSGSVSTRNVIRATGGFFPWGLVNGFTDMMKGAAACAIVEFAICPAHPNLDYIVVLTALAILKTRKNSNINSVMFWSYLGLLTAWNILEYIWGWRLIPGPYAI